MFLLTEASMPILMFPPWSTCTHSSSMYMVFLSILWASPQISSLQRSFIWPYPLLQRVTEIPSILYLPFCLRTLNATYSFRSVLLGFCLFDLRSHVSPALKLLSLRILSGRLNSCLHLLSAEITAVCFHSAYAVLGLSPGAFLYAIQILYSWATFLPLFLVFLLMSAPPSVLHNFQMSGILYIVSTKSCISFQVM